MGLFIFDDFLPNPLSGFRVVEFGGLLKVFRESQVRCQTPYTASEFDAHLEALVGQNPVFAERLFRFDPNEQPSRNSRAYATFLNNAMLFVDYFEQKSLPFVFQLAPGGGFALEHGESDSKIKRVVSSPMFQGVITTQPVTTAYLRVKFKVPPLKICEARPGCILFDPLVAQAPRIRTHRNKWFDIGFMAMQYNNCLSNKGYDFFIATAKKLARQEEKIRFHVYGNYAPRDIDLSGLEGRIRHYGVLKADDFPAAFARIDAIFSPNVPFVLAPGNFDGFPTSCVAEAALTGVVPIMSDILNLNRDLVDGRDFVLLNRDPSRVAEGDVATAAEIVLALSRNPVRWNLLSRGAQSAFRQLFSPSRQLEPRARFIARRLFATRIALTPRPKARTGNGPVGGPRAGQDDEC